MGAEICDCSLFPPCQLQRSPEAIVVNTLCYTLILWMLLLLTSFPSPRLKSLCFRIQKMMEVYKPDWCESREEWSVYLFSPQNK